MLASQRVDVARDRRRPTACALPLSSPPSVAASCSRSADRRELLWALCPIVSACSRSKLAKGELIECHETSRGPPPDHHPATAKWRASIPSERSQLARRMVRRVPLGQGVGYLTVRSSRARWAALAARVVVVVVTCSGVSSSSRYSWGAPTAAFQ